MIVMLPHLPGEDLPPGPPTRTRHTVPGVCLTVIENIGGTASLRPGFLMRSTRSGSLVAFVVEEDSVGFGEGEVGEFLGYGSHAVAGFHVGAHVLTASLVQFIGDAGVYLPVGPVPAKLLQVEFPIRHRTPFSFLKSQSVHSSTYSVRRTRTRYRSRSGWSGFLRWNSFSAMVRSYGGVD